MNVREAIFKRRTIHAFDKRKVNDLIILNAIEAANQAPSHKLTFPWRFYLVNNTKRKEIIDLSIKLKSQNKIIEKNSRNLIVNKLLNPSHFLIASQFLSKDNLIRKEDYAACSCAIQNLSISLASEGVSSKWSTGGITRSNEIYEITKINPKLEEIIGFILIGYGQELPKIKRPKISTIYREL